MSFFRLVGVFTMWGRGVSTLYRGLARASGCVYDAPSSGRLPSSGILYIVVEPVKGKNYCGI
nr:MAG TPA: hypothetical protein [Caudoviricetes sp.]